MAAPAAVSAGADGSVCPASEQSQQSADAAKAALNVYDMSVIKQYVSSKQTKQKKKREPKEPAKPSEDRPKSRPDISQPVTESDLEAIKRTKYSNPQQEWPVASEPQFKLVTEPIEPIYVHASPKRQVEIDRDPELQPDLAHPVTDQHVEATKVYKIVPQGHKQVWIDVTRDIPWTECEPQHDYVTGTLLTPDGVPVEQPKRRRLAKNLQDILDHPTKFTLTVMSIFAAIGAMCGFKYSSFVLHSIRAQQV